MILEQELPPDLIVVSAHVLQHPERIESGHRHNHENAAEPRH
jgi:hypothetical protein